MTTRAVPRRKFLTWLAAGTVLPFAASCGSHEAEAKQFPLQLTDEQWRTRLTAEQYRVLRGKGTERPYASALNKEKRAGIFHCAGCAQKLFSSKTKYDSGTGWPSFWRPLKGAVGTATDYGLGLPRTEVHCSRCGGHLGHVFKDGPQPTGLRYCMNGVALDFTPGAA